MDMIAKFYTPNKLFIIANGFKLSFRNKTRGILDIRGTRLSITYYSYSKDKLCIWFIQQSKRSHVWGIVPSSEKLYFYTKKSLKILIQNPYIIRICSRIVGAYKRDILFPQIDIMKITHYKILILRMLVLVGIYERGGDPDKFNINDTNIK